jgi:hypothetical protein
MMMINLRKEGEIIQHARKSQFTLKPKQPTESMVKFMNTTTPGKFNLKEQSLVTKI